jgi:hypothetical protein
MPRWLSITAVSSPLIAVGKNNKKLPTARDVPSREKLPKSSPAESFYDRRPSWRVGRMELIDPFGWHKVPAAKLYEIRDKLAGFEGQTWGDIIMKSQNNHHFMTSTSICDEAQGRLGSLHMEDTDSLFSLRLTGPERIWGISR